MNQSKLNIAKKKFGDTKWVIRSRKSKKDIHYNGQKKNDKSTNNDHRKLKIEQHKPHKKPGVPWNVK